MAIYTFTKQRIKKIYSYFDKDINKSFSSNLFGFNSFCIRFTIPPDLNDYTKRYKDTNLCMVKYNADTIRRNYIVPVDDPKYLRTVLNEIVHKYSQEGFQLFSYNKYYNNVSFYICPDKEKECYYAVIIDLATSF